MTSEVVISSFKGLFSQPNSYKLTPGSMELAHNVSIESDDIIESRRGFYQVSAISNTKQIAQYKTAMIVFTTTQLKSVSSADSVTTLSGSVSIDNAYSAQANDNLYFTTLNGVKKIESPTTKIEGIGVAPALDLSATLLNSSGFFSPGKQVAYRVLFGKKDLNKNVILGAPSAVSFLTNPTQEATFSYADPVCTVTLTAHGLATNDVIRITVSDNANFVGNDYTVTVLTANTFTFNQVAAGTPTTGSLNFGKTKQVRLEFSVPEEINSTDYFFQVYRSTQSVDEDTLPLANYKLVDEVQLTSTQIATNIAFYNDNNDDIFVSSAAELYTNENSREGEAQANARPPLASDVAYFKNMLFYANTKTRGVLQASLINATIANNSIFTITDTTNSLNYDFIAKTELGNAVETLAATFVTTTITVTRNSHGLSTGDVIVASNAVGTGTLPDGAYAVSATTTNTLSFVVSVAPTTLTFLDIQAVKDSSNRFIFSAKGNVPTVAVGIADTAKALCKAINRNPNVNVYAQYTSGIDDIPGKFFLESVGFDKAYTITSSTISANFQPTLSSLPLEASIEGNALFVSKLGEPEAVPRLNKLLVGTKSAQIKRIVSLRDSLIILKEDGIFRISGDSPGSLVSLAIDSSVFCVAKNSVQPIANNVYLLSNQGVVSVSETSVSILSRPIEKLMTSILTNPNLDAETGSGAYESRRTYYLSTVEPNSSAKSITYAYNYITNAWVTSDILMKDGAVSLADNYYCVNTALLKERRLNKKTDYADESFTTTVVSISGNTVVFNAGNFSVGQAFVFNDVISRPLSIDNLTVTFRDKPLYETSNVVTVYQPIAKRMTFSPIHKGSLSLQKQFTQAQLHFKNRACSRFTLSFQSEMIGGSDSTEFISNSAEGWGQGPWGFFPWGSASGINIDLNSSPRETFRTYISKWVGRSAYIQPKIEANEACDPFLLQAFALTVSGPNSERVAR